jgi:hypothetical protein
VETKAVTGQRSLFHPAGNCRVLAITIMAAITKPMERISVLMMRKECINMYSMFPHHGRIKK